MNSQEISANELSQILGLNSINKRKGEKKKQRDHGSKKFKIDNNDGSTTITNSSAINFRNDPSLSLRQVHENLESPTEGHKLVDPILRQEIQNVLVHRNQCTVKVLGLPLKLTASMIEEIAPDTKAYRIPWVPRLHRGSGCAYLEFESEQQAVLHKEKLQDYYYQQRSLSTSLGKFISENIDEYDCKRLVLHGLHWKIGRGEIARRFPTCTDIQLPPIVPFVDKRKPGIAYLTFSTEGEALDALKKRQGTVIRGRKTSVHFYWKHGAGDHKSKKCLCVFGLKKEVSEDDLKCIFPQASVITINRLCGEAKLQYELEEDCILDYNNAKGVKLRNKKIGVLFAPYKVDGLPNLTALTGNIETKAPSEIVGIIVDKFDTSVSDQDLWTLFPNAKEIRVTRPPNSSSGSAYVTFLNKGAAKHAIKNASHKLLGGRIPRARLATPKRLRLLEQPTTNCVPFKQQSDTSQNDVTVVLEQKAMKKRKLKIVTNKSKTLQTKRKKRRVNEFVEHE